MLSPVEKKTLGGGSAKQKRKKKPPTKKYPYHGGPRATDYEKPREFMRDSLVYGHSEKKPHCKDNDVLHPDNDANKGGKRRVILLTKKHSDEHGRKDMCTLPDDHKRTKVSTKSSDEHGRKKSPSCRPDSSCYNKCVSRTDSSASVANECGKISKNSHGSEGKIGTCTSLEEVALRSINFCSDDAVRLFLSKSRSILKAQKPPVLDSGISGPICDPRKQRRKKQLCKQLKKIAGPILKRKLSTTCSSESVRIHAAGSNDSLSWFLGSRRKQRKSGESPKRKRHHHLYMRASCQKANFSDRASLESLIKIGKNCGKPCCKRRMASQALTSQPPIPGAGLTCDRINDGPHRRVEEHRCRIPLPLPRERTLSRPVSPATSRPESADLSSVLSRISIQSLERLRRDSDDLDLDDAGVESVPWPAALKDQYRCLGKEADLGDAMAEYVPWSAASKDQCGYSEKEEDLNDAMVESEPWSTASKNQCRYLGKEDLDDARMESVPCSAASKDQSRCSGKKADAPENFCLQRKVASCSRSSSRGSSARSSSLSVITPPGSSAEAARPRFKCRANIGSLSTLESVSVESLSELAACKDGERSRRSASAEEDGRTLPEGGSAKSDAVSRKEAEVEQPSSTKGDGSWDGESVVVQRSHDGTNGSNSQIASIDNDRPETVDDDCGCESRRCGRCGRRRSSGDDREKSFSSDNPCSRERKPSSSRARRSRDHRRRSHDSRRGSSLMDLRESPRASRMEDRGSSRSSNRESKGRGAPYIGSSLSTRSNLDDRQWSASNNQSYTESRSTTARTSYDYSLPETRKSSASVFRDRKSSRKYRHEDKFRCDCQIPARICPEQPVCVSRGSFREDYSRRKSRSHHKRKYKDRRMYTRDISIPNSECCGCRRSEYSCRESPRNWMPLGNDCRTDKYCIPDRNTGETSMRSGIIPCTCSSQASGIRRGKNSPPCVEILNIERKFDEDESVTKWVLSYTDRSPNTCPVESTDDTACMVDKFSSLFSDLSQALSEAKASLEGSQNIDTFSAPSRANGYQRKSESPLRIGSLGKSDMTMGKNLKSDVDHGYQPFKPFPAQISLSQVEQRPSKVRSLMQNLRQSLVSSSSTQEMRRRPSPYGERDTRLSQLLRRCSSSIKYGAALPSPKVSLRSIRDRNPPCSLQGINGRMNKCPLAVKGSVSACRKEPRRFGSVFDINEERSGISCKECVRRTPSTCRNINLRPLERVAPSPNSCIGKCYSCSKFTNPFLTCDSLKNPFENGALPSIPSPNGQPYCHPGICPASSHVASVQPDPLQHCILARKPQFQPCASSQDPPFQQTSPVQQSLLDTPLSLQQPPSSYQHISLRQPLSFSETTSNEYYPSHQQSQQLLYENQSVLENLPPSSLEYYSNQNSSFQQSPLQQEIQDLNTQPNQYFAFRQSFPCPDHSPCRLTPFQETQPYQLCQSQSPFQPSSPLQHSSWGPHPYQQASPCEKPPEYQASQFQENPCLQQPPSFQKHTPFNEYPCICPRPEQKGPPQLFQCREFTQYTPPQSTGCPPNQQVPPYAQPCPLQSSLQPPPVPPRMNHLNPSIAFRRTLPPEPPPPPPPPSEPPPPPPPPSEPPPPPPSEPPPPPPSEPPPPPPSEPPPPLSSEPPPLYEPPFLQDPPPHDEETPPCEEPPPAEEPTCVGEPAEEAPPFELSTPYQQPWTVDAPTVPFPLPPQLPPRPPPPSSPASTRSSPRTATRTSPSSSRFPNRPRSPCSTPFNRPCSNKSDFRETSPCPRGRSQTKSPTNKGFPQRGAQGCVTRPNRCFKSRRCCTNTWAQYSMLATPLPFPAFFNILRPPDLSNPSLSSKMSFNNG